MASIPTVSARPLVERLRVLQQRELHSLEITAATGGNASGGWNTLGERLGVSGRQLLRYCEAERISVWVADRMAIRLGSHPLFLWGPEFYSNGGEENGG